jgi:hypothetical protein
MVCKPVESETQHTFPKDCTKHPLLRMTKATRRELSSRMTTIQMLPAMLTKPKLLHLRDVSTADRLTLIRMNKTREIGLPRVDGLLLYPLGYHNGDVVCFLSNLSRGSKLTSL